MTLRSCPRWWNAPPPGYARQYTSGWTAPSTASPSQTQNSASITFGPFTAAMSVPVVACAMVTQLTGTAGFFLWWWVLDNARQAGNGESLIFSPGSLVMTLT